MEMIETVNNVVVLNEQPEFIAVSSDEVSANYFVLCENSQGNGLTKPVHEYTIAGMSVLNWVVRACEKQPVVLNVPENADVLEVVKPYAKSADYSVVLYADTPLVNKGHIKDLLAFVARKQMNACKLKRGFVFRNDYILNVDEIYSIDTYDFATNDFFEIKSLEDLAFAQVSLLKKVISYMQKKGVYFENANMVTVDALTDIGYGTSVAPNASIIRGSLIGTNSKISANSLVSGSKVGNNVHIGRGAMIVDSIVKDGSYIEDGSIVKDSLIGENCAIGFACKVVGSGLKSNAKVGKLSTVTDSKFTDAVEIGENKVMIKNKRVGSV